MRQDIRVDGARLSLRLINLAEVGAIPGGGVCRLALTDADKAGRDLVVRWMRELGLAVSIDAIGNVIGVRAGTRSGPPVMTGSHIDTVAHRRPYDGCLGVLAGLEVVATLNDAGIVTRRPLAVAFFTNEEGAASSPICSAAWSIPAACRSSARLATVGIDGTIAGEELARIGYAGTAPVGQPHVHAYVELHIEQGPVLEAEGFRIGAVEGVQGISWTEFTLTGQSNHAGTTPMRMRHDAGYVAAEIAAFARRLAQEIGGNQVATVGALTLSPNLVNVVADRAVMTVDLRNTDNDRLKQAERRLFAFVAKTAAAEGVSVSASLARPLRSGRIRAASGRAGRSHRAGIRSAGEAAAQRRRTRRADAGGGLPGLHDLRPQRQRHQPQHPRIHRARGPRRRRQCAAAADARTGSVMPTLIRDALIVNGDGRDRAVPRRRADRRRHHRCAGRGDPVASANRRQR